MKRIPLALLALLIAATLSWLVTYQLALWISPARVVEANGVVHPTMPIGQVMVASLVSAVMAVVAAIFAFRHR